LDNFRRVNLELRVIIAKALPTLQTLSHLYLPGKLSVKCSPEVYRQTRSATDTLSLSGVSACCRGCHGCTPVT